MKRRAESLRSDLGDKELFPAIKFPRLAISFVVSLPDTPLRMVTWGATTVTLFRVCSVSNLEKGNPTRAIYWDSIRNNALRI